MRRVLIAAIALATCCGSVLATDGRISFMIPHAIVPGVEAIPLIARAITDGEKRINVAVGRLDEKVRRAVAQCRRDGGSNADWNRSVAITMRGPRFLSYTIDDSSFCGGAHPNTSMIAIVYDLRTGRPVDWTKLLPSSLTGTVALDEAADGSKVVTLSSAKLHSLYVAGYRPDQTGKDTDECRQAVASVDGGHPAMMAWLDAKQDGLAVQFNLPHYAQACADPVVVSVQTLRVLGTQPVLTSAITAASTASQ